MAIGSLDLQSVLLQYIDKISVRNHSSLYSKVLKVMTTDVSVEDDSSASLGDSRYTLKPEFEKDTYRLLSSLKSFNYNISDKFEDKERDKYNTLELVPELLNRIGNYRVSIGKQFGEGIYKVNFFKVFKGGKLLTSKELEKEFENPMQTVYLEDISVKKLAKNFEETSRNLEGSLAIKFGSFDLLTREYAFEYFMGKRSDMFDTDTDLGTLVDNKGEPKFTLKDLIYPKTSLSNTKEATPHSENYIEKDMKFYLIFEYITEQAGMTSAEKETYQHPFYDLVRNPIILECIVYKHEIDLPTYYKDRDIKPDSFYYTLKTSFTAYSEAVSKNPGFGTKYDIFSAFDGSYAKSYEDIKKEILKIENDYRDSCKEAKTNQSQLKPAKEEYFKKIKEAREKIQNLVNPAKSETISEETNIIRGVGGAGSPIVRRVTAKESFNTKFNNFINYYRNVSAFPVFIFQKNGTPAQTDLLSNFISVNTNEKPSFANFIAPRPIIDFIDQFAGIQSDAGLISSVGAADMSRVVITDQKSGQISERQDFNTINYIFFGDLLEALFPDDSINTCGEVNVVFGELFPRNGVLYRPAGSANQPVLVNIADIPVSIALLQEVKKEFIDNRVEKREEGFSSLAFVNAVINKIQAASVTNFGDSFVNISEMNILNNAVVNQLNILKVINPDAAEKIQAAKSKYNSFSNNIPNKEAPYEANTLLGRNIKVFKNSEEIQLFLKKLSDDAFGITNGRASVQIPSELTYNHIWYSPTKKFISKDFLTDYAKSEESLIPLETTNATIPNSFHTRLNVQKNPDDRSSFFSWLRRNFGMHGFSVDPIYGGYVEIKNNELKNIIDKYTGRTIEMEMQPSIKSMSLERMDIAHLREAQITSDKFSGFIRLPYKATIEFYAPFFNIFENGDYLYLLPPVLFNYTDEQLSKLSFEKVKESFITNFNQMGIGGVYLITDLDLKIKFLPKITNDAYYTIDNQNSSCVVSAVFSSFGDGTPSVSQASQDLENCIALPTEEP